MQGGRGISSLQTGRLREIVVIFFWAAKRVEKQAQREWSPVSHTIAANSIMVCRWENNQYSKTRKSFFIIIIYRFFYIQERIENNVKKKGLQTNKPLRV